MLDVTSANSTNAGTDETSANLLNDRINLMAATTLLGVTYGIMFTLYCITIHSLLRKLYSRNSRAGLPTRAILRRKTEWRKPAFYIAYTSVLFILATLYTAGNSQNAILAYVDNRSFPGGPYQYFITSMANQSVMVMTDVVSLIILWMTDALILCRFIILYYQAPYAKWIIPLPCAMYVGVIVLSTLVLQGEAGLGEIFYSSEDMVLAYYALSFSLSVVATVLIAARLYWHKIQLERVFGRSVESPYMSIATMLIESAALYCIWSLMFLILCVLGNPGQTIILATMNQIQVIAPLLIILWMARGNTWGSRHSQTCHGFDTTIEPPRLSDSIRRLSFVTRPVAARIVSKFSLDDDDMHTSSDRNASSSTVAGRRGHDDISAIELGLCGSRPMSVAEDPKV